MQMGKWINILYGAILVYISVEALNWLNFIPKEFLPYEVLLMGVIVLFTPIGIAPAGYPEYTTRPKVFDNLRRYFFGAVLVLIGLASSLGAVGDWAPLLTLGSTSGSLILSAVAVIYFLTAFSSTRGIGGPSSI